MKKENKARKTRRNSEGPVLEPDAENCGMTMRYPASRWQDATPTGSGSVGALIFGRIQDESIILNHDRLYYPKGGAKMADISDKLPELRSLIRSGRYKEADALMTRTYGQRIGRQEIPEYFPGGPRDPYQPFCEIRISGKTSGPFRKYRRGLDFRTGRAWTSWIDDGGGHFREAFVSRSSDYLFLRMRANGPSGISCRVSLDKCPEVQRLDPRWSGTEGVEVSVLGRMASSDGIISLAMAYPGGFSFGAVARVQQKGGKLAAEKNEIVVSGAREILLKVALFLGEESKTAIDRISRTLLAGGIAFDREFQRHSDLHGEIYDRLCLEISGKCGKSNEELLLEAYEGDVPGALVQKLFGFGRHLLISSSRPGSWPPNLQGIWNGDYSPAWNSDFHTDENVQMNLWQALPGRMPETHLPFFDYFERFIPEYRDNAREIYGCRGIFVPIGQTTSGRDYPCVWTGWTGAAGWIAQHFYDYFLFTGDMAFLRERAVPWLSEVALFYEDFLVEDEAGKYLFCPSMSPENVPGGSGFGYLAMNATMDVAICREVLGNLSSACELLGIRGGDVRRWRKMLGKLPEYSVNEDGALREWLHPGFKDNYHHRHQSHLYPLFPGFEVTQESSPEIFEGCRVAVEKRLVIGLESQTGWSMAHMANIYARLGMGNRALECIELLARSGVGPNLFTYHNDWRGMGLSIIWAGNPPFQIDANLGIAAAVQEMLLFSAPGIVKVLPALPDKWAAGSFKGLASRCGVVVGADWDRKKNSLRAVLEASRDSRFLLKLPGWLKKPRFSPAGIAKPVQKGKSQYWEISLEAGKRLVVSGIGA